RNRLSDQRGASKATRLSRNRHLVYGWFDLVMPFVFLTRAAKHVASWPSTRSDSLITTVSFPTIVSRPFPRPGRRRCLVRCSQFTTWSRRWLARGPFRLIDSP